MSIDDRKPERIVAEVSKSWTIIDIRMDGPGVLSQRFEAVIDRNRDRGYALESWQFASASPRDGELVETIIAVFVRQER